MFMVNGKQTIYKFVLFLNLKVELILIIVNNIQMLFSDSLLLKSLLDLKFASL